MIRFQVMEKVTVGISEDLQEMEIYDVLSVNWAKFRFDGDELLYELTQEDVNRPDILSIKQYGTVDYQNIIFLINNIGDLLNLTIGEKIRLPKIQNIRQFMYNNRKSS